MDFNSVGISKHIVKNKVPDEHKHGILFDIEHYRDIFKQEHRKLIVEGNKRFGQDSWSHSVSKLQTECIEYNDRSYFTAASAIVKIELKKGIYHEEVGYGFSCGLENKLISIVNASQEAKLEAFKNALESFSSETVQEFHTNESVPVVTHSSVHTKTSTSQFQSVPLQSDFASKTSKSCTPPSTSKIVVPMGSSSEKEQNDLRAERKRKQQKLQEEFRLRMKLKEQEHCSRSKENINGCLKNEPAIDDESTFISTQELDEVMKSAMIPSKSMVPQCRMPLISSPAQNSSSRWGPV